MNTTEVYGTNKVKGNYSGSHRDQESQVSTIDSSEAYRRSTTEDDRSVVVSQQTPDYRNVATNTREHV